jgi:hypothetical protein
MRSDRRYYLNADRSKIVEEGSSEAAYLLAAEGADIPTEDARRYKLGRYADDEASVAQDVAADAKAEEKPADAKAVAGPPENKAQGRAASKADESK